MDPVDAMNLPTVHSLGKGLGQDVDESTALRAFDAYFLGEMLRRSAPQNPTGLFDGGQAGRMYQDYLYQEMARIIAERGDFGIAASLEGQLSKTPEGSSDETADRESDRRDEER